ncbi:hypothetical protein, partial [Salmonella enterica]|uniref:hypothetical protein n=1 Tax=Salmonella enterica TaxID=28901 RepID=UPI001C3DB508
SFVIRHVVLLQKKFSGELPVWRCPDKKSFIPVRPVMQPRIIFIQYSVTEILIQKTPVTS